MRIFCLLGIFVISIAGFSQAKIEREVSVKVDQVPTKAVQFIKQSNIKSKVRWYQEFSAKSYSFEAKTKLNKLWHSIEFDSTGTLEDVEVKRKVSDLSVEIANNIQQFLKTNYVKHKILKLQYQYSGEIRSLQDLSQATMKFELEVHAKKANEISAPYEITFDSTGKHLMTRRIQPSKLENIEN